MGVSKPVQSIMTNSLGDNIRQVLYSLWDDICGYKSDTCHGEECICDNVLPSEKDRQIDRLRADKERSARNYG